MAAVGVVCALTAPTAIAAPAIDGKTIKKSSVTAKQLAPDSVGGS